MFFDNILFFIVALVAIWLGAGLIVQSVNALSKNLKVSSFALSFFILGILTSTPEIAVGVSSLSENRPEIFVGNLLGGIAVIFLLIIPFLAVIGNGVSLNHQLSKRNLILSLLVIALPSLLVIDKRVSNLEGMVMIGAYLALFYFIERRNGVFEEENKQLLNLKSYSFFDILKVVLGIILVFIASQTIVDKTIYFSEVFNISPFFISLFLLSVGTNLPELSLAVRSVYKGKKDVALGDYMGSAAANTLLFGIFTILNQGEVLTEDNFLASGFFIVLSLAIFYYFAHYRKSLSRQQGFLILGLYLLFALVEFSRTAS